LEKVIAWIVSLIASVAPLDRPQYIPEARETVEETQERYESIARNLIEVVYDQNENPLFPGARGRQRTITVVLAAATFESSFRRDVDFGEGKFSRGDHGKSWCLNQLNLGVADPEGITPNRILVTSSGGYKFVPKTHEEGWTGTELVQDRTKCFRAALAVLRSSFASCRSLNLPLEDRLRVYASGDCEKGSEASHRRMGLALRWMSTKKPDFTDSDVFKWLKSDGVTPKKKPLSLDDYLALNYGSKSPLSGS
jgi:hypothetical protein